MESNMSECRCHVHAGGEVVKLHGVGCINVLKCAFVYAWEKRRIPRDGQRARQQATSEKTKGRSLTGLIECAALGTNTLIISTGYFCTILSRPYSGEFIGRNQLNRLRSRRFGKVGHVDANSAQW